MFKSEICNRKNCFKILLILLVSVILTQYFYSFVPENITRYIATQALHSTHSSSEYRGRSSEKMELDPTDISPRFSFTNKLEKNGNLYDSLDEPASSTRTVDARNTPEANSPSNDVQNISNNITATTDTQNPADSRTISEDVQNVLHVNTAITDTHKPADGRTMSDDVQNDSYSNTATTDTQNPPDGRTRSDNVQNVSVSNTATTDTQNPPGLSDDVQNVSDSNTDTTDTQSPPDLSDDVQNVSDTNTAITDSQKQPDVSEDVQKVSDRNTATTKSKIPPDSRTTSDDVQNDSDSNTATTDAENSPHDDNYTVDEHGTSLITTPETDMQSPPSDIFPSDEQNVSTTSDSQNRVDDSCDDKRNLLGLYTINETIPSLSEMTRKMPELQLGGYFDPKCKHVQNVAILLPYRDRESNLAILLNNLHPFLQRQKIEYQIFVIEQAGTDPFNRAMLLNIGFSEALKRNNFTCFIFHDVDHIPENDYNLYECPDPPAPLHMAVGVSRWDYKMPYGLFFGGVSAMTTEHFRLVNGFSNRFWGWGGEDDEIAYRIIAHGLQVIRHDVAIARYRTLDHTEQVPNPDRSQILAEGSKHYKTDGLSNLEYTVEEIVTNRLYTFIKVSIESLSEDGQQNETEIDMVSNL